MSGAERRGSSAWRTGVWARRSMGKALGSCRFQPTRGGSLRLRAPGTTLWISTGKGARLRASAEVVPAPPRGLARLAGEAGRAPAGLDHPSLLVLAAG